MKYKELEEKEKAIKYFEEQNKKTDEYLEDTKELQKEIFNEIKNKITDYQSYPIKKEKYKYYYKDYKDLQYPIHYRENGEEEIILDENKLAGKSKSMILPLIKVSEDEKYLAYLYNLEGSDELKLEIKEIENNEIIFEEEKVTDIEFYKKNFYYIKQDETLKPYQLYKANLRGKKLLYEERKPEAFLYLEKSNDKEKLYLNSKTMQTNEVRVVNEELSVHRERKDKVNYHLENWEGKNIVLSNEEIKDYKVYLEEKELYAPEKGSIEDIEITKDYLVIIERYEEQKIKYMNLKTKEVKEIELDDIYEIESVINEKYKENKLIITVSNLKTPEKIYTYNLETEKLELVKEQRIPNYKPEEYEIKRTHSEDIPITLLYKKENKNSKMLLTAYGSYGVNYPLSYRKSLISMLDRGIKIAIAHVRGGGEKGEQWHEEGKLLQKKNTFEDFIKVTKYLIENNYTKTNKLAITGGSAGGMLIGAVINMKPELYKTAIAQVPFVDVLETMQNEKLPLTTLEWEEWGNPKEEEFYNYIKSYSPIDNVEKQRYPNVLITTSINDTRVPYWEPAKWHKKLKDNSENSNIYIKTNLESGHAGPISKDESIKETSYEFAYIIKNLEE